MVRTDFGMAGVEDTDKGTQLVALVSVEVIPAAPTTSLTEIDEREIIVSNDGLQDAWLSTDGPAVVGEGILVPKGDSRKFNAKTAVNGIVAAASTNLGWWSRECIL